MQRFVDASILGWRHYLHGDNAAANALIRQANPDMTDEQIGYSVGKLREYGIVESGDALSSGVGAMTDARIASFFRKMVAANVVPEDLDYRAAYTLRFVNKGVGIHLDH